MYTDSAGRNEPLQTTITHLCFSPQNVQPALQRENLLAIPRFFFTRPILKIPWPTFQQRQQLTARRKSLHFLLYFVFDVENALPGENGVVQFLDGRVNSGHPFQKAVWNRPKMFWQELQHRKSQPLRAIPKSQLPRAVTRSPALCPFKKKMKWKFNGNLDNSYKHSTLINFKWFQCFFCVKIQQADFMIHFLK